MSLRLDGLRLQLLGLVILPFVLVLLAVALAGVQIHQQAMRGLVAERDARAVRSAASALTETLLHDRAAVAWMAQSVADGASPSIVLSEATRLSAGFDRGIAILDAEGKIMASTLPAETWTERPVQLGLEVPVDGFLFSQPFDEAGSPVVMVAARVRDTVVVGAFTTRFLLADSFLTSAGSGAQEGAYLVDSAGRLLDWEGSLAPPAEPLGHPGVRDALEGESGTAYIGAGGAEHVVAFSPVQPTGWALITEEPWESVASPVLNVSLMAPLVLIPALLITLLGLWFGARQVVQPLRQLDQEAVHMAEDDVPAPSTPLGGIAEIRDLQRTLNSMAQRIRSARVALRRYIGQITNAQEDERRRLARDLHDETIQELIALDQQVQMLGLDLQAKQLPEAERAERIHRTATEIIAGIRRMTRALRPIYLEDLGLVPALGMLASGARDAMGIPVSFQSTGAERRLDPNAELAIYRILQEALSNAARHAHASSIRMEVDFGPAELSCRVKDNGVGFAVPSQNGDLTSRGHFGLMGMRERSDIAEGTLQIISAPGVGTTVEITVPYSVQGAHKGE